jgi:hypothetical protein
MDTLYSQILDILVTLNAVNNRFTPFSAQDIKKLIAAKLKAKTQKEPADLQHLYKLEAIIRELRESFNTLTLLPSDPIETSK